MAHTPTRKLPPFEIPVHSKPPDYRPGDGPALAPIRLCLEDDTGAFIVDKRVLPGKPVNGELKLELYYVVGWPDLPAARVAILATKILEYVSPRTLEDWEYECLLEKDKEREKQEVAQKIKQEERAKAHAASVSVMGTPTPDSGIPGQKRRGRPSKAEMLARRIAQQASFGDDELANVPLPSAGTSGPSLSTPKKSLARAVTHMDIDKTDINDAILKQLQGGSETERESDNESQAGQDLAELDEPYTMARPDTDTMFTSLDSFLPAHPSRGYAEFLIPNLPSPTQQDPAQSVPSIPISFSRPNSKNSQLSRQKTQLTTPVPVPAYPRKSEKNIFIPLGKSITPVPPPSLPPRAKPPKQAHAISVTPIPAPSCSISEPKPLLKVPHGVGFTPTPIPAPAWPEQTPQVFHGTTCTPIPPPSYPPPLRESATKPELKKTHKAYTPNPPPPPPKPSEELRKISYTPIPPPRPFSITESSKWTGFTPAGQGPRNQGTRVEAQVERNEPRTTSKNATPGAKSSSSRKKKQSQPEEEQAWEVKRLEDDKVIEINGELIRHFKVRWVGKWPPGQNPTWEPEENISEPLIRKYLKDKAAKVSQEGSSPRKPEKPPPTLKRKYSSVAEAFQGDGNDLPGPSSGLLGEAHDADDDDDEHLQVTE
ncbi:hypothetical protein FHL15_008991 [Xylaria flabelliformis]|uniref:Chromo domain-containing protein n=1 Tax=Xylaria flabelliformis TaxID=2512241 RepID=A0A553HQ44_9PEZI|nr:hypothetical protein FHL15_008991 [Xylaria flabelliformis]